MLLLMIGGAAGRYPPSPIIFDVPLHTLAVDVGTHTRRNSTFIHTLLQDVGVHTREDTAFVYFSVPNALPSMFGLEMFGSSGILGGGQIVSYYRRGKHRVSSVDNQFRARVIHQ